jgi:hypothetical protein
VGEEGNDEQNEVVEEEDVEVEDLDEEEVEDDELVSSIDPSDDEDWDAELDEMTETQKKRRRQEKKKSKFEEKLKRDREEFDREISLGGNSCLTEEMLAKKTLLDKKAKFLELLNAVPEEEYDRIDLSELKVWGFSFGNFTK